MTVIKKLSIALLATVAVLIGSVTANQITGTDSFSVISKAEARVGRPLTPVSVAGVARRTTSRCAAGVYNC